MVTRRYKVIRAVYEVCEQPEEYAYSTPEAVYSKFKHLCQETKEHFIALHLDSKNKLLCVDVVSVGSLNQSSVHPREVMKAALLSSCCSLILIHNHPSGDSLPSNEDKKITQRLREAAELLGIRVLDHIIIGNGEYYSFKENHEL